jgi:hypothetical protein
MHSGDLAILLRRHLGDHRSFQNRLRDKNFSELDTGWEKNVRMIRMCKNVWDGLKQKGKETEE